MTNLKDVLDNISDGIMEIDETGIIVYCNQKVTRLDDIQRQEVIGKPLLAVYPSLDQSTSTLFQVLKTGKPIYNLEQTFVTYRGKTIATINTTLPLFSDGLVVGAVEISRDITDVKAMSERIADLQRRVYQTQGKMDQALGDYVQYSFESILTEDYRLNKLKEMAKKAALTVSPILVVGETGTGKELFVQAIHQGSSRVNAPFIAQNCAALPANLLEGILFGTVEGAYTGAKDRMGLLEVAHGGTLFLDEINSMPQELQAKLLRFLQDGWIRRVGDTTSRRVDVRIITAMNVVPEQAIEQGLIRQDLFYRLNTIILELPPLRERKADITLLVPVFIERFNRLMNKRIKGVTKEVLECFEHYSWPGNVRELEHIIEASMSMSEGEWVGLDELPESFLGCKDYSESMSAGIQVCQDVSLPFDEAMIAYERQMIRHALITTGHNISLAAKELGLPRQTLQYKLKKHHL